MKKQGKWNQGSTLLLYTVAMVAMMGMAALAIDLGFLRKARAEAQRAADAAALAGASAFLLNLTQAAEIDSARTRAYRVANQNSMNGVAFDTTSEVTVTIIPDSVKVRVKARRASVPTWFARVFGINTLPVGAIAAAEAAYATGASCTKPIVMPDLWDDKDNDPNGNHEVDPGEQWDWTLGTDEYHPANWDYDNNGAPNDGYGTGLGSELRNVPRVLPPGTVPGQRDWGRLVLLKPPVSGGHTSACPNLLTSNGSKCYIPSFWGWWGGNPKTRSDMILTCSGQASVGVPVDIETGVTNALMDDFGTLLSKDPNAVWNPNVRDSITGNMGTVVNSTQGGTPLGGKWIASSRNWTVAMMAPDQVPTSGGQATVLFNNFMNFFAVGCYDTNKDTFSTTDCKGPHMALVGRFVGLAKGTKFGPSPGTMVRALRLVE